MEKQKTQLYINGVEYVYIDTPYWDSEKKRGHISGHTSERTLMVSLFLTRAISSSRSCIS